MMRGIGTRAWCVVRATAIASTALAIVAGLVGHALRDRTVLLALMMYLPLIPLGICAVAIDLASRGRAVRRPRWALAVLGCVAAAVGLSSMVTRATFGGGEDVRPDDLTVLQWNVEWGGHLAGGQEAGWHEMFAKVRAARPDVAIFNEAAPTPWVDRAIREAGWSYTLIEHEPGQSYFYRLVVCSPWPVAPVATHAFRNGSGLTATVHVGGRPMRVLVADGVSTPWVLRTPFLTDVATELARARAAGRPVDIVAGDFNAVSRSIGFDAFGGSDTGPYALADALAPWRGTFPAPVLPLYDIDHVWVGGRYRVTECRGLGHPITSHRARLVRVRGWDRG